MQVLILSLLMLFSLGFFVLAFVLREDERGGYALLTGFVVLLFAGLLVGFNGVSYVAGTNATATVSGNVTVTDTAYVYNPVSDLERSAITLPLILAGLWGSIACMLAMRDSRY